VISQQQAQTRRTAQCGVAGKGTYWGAAREAQVRPFFDRERNE
jgi:hypothetical protein